MRDSTTVKYEWVYVGCAWVLVFSGVPEFEQVCTGVFSCPWMCAGVGVYDEFLEYLLEA